MFQRACFFLDFYGELDAFIFNVGPLAGPRASSTMVALGDKLVIFGGYDGEEFMDVSRAATCHRLCILGLYSPIL